MSWIKSLEGRENSMVMRTPNYNNWYLVGFMGTGKSAIAKALAKRSNRKCIDMDDEIEQKAEMPISQIFATKGEPYFRQMECDLLKNLSEKKGSVVACGGGVVINPKNWEYMKSSGLVICLSSSIDAILFRLKGDNTRPLLQVENVREKISLLLNRRAEFYDKAHFKVDTSKMDPDAAAANIMALICSL